MKKYLLALVVLSTVGGGVRAQSSVTLYGIVDSGLLFQSKTAGDAGKGFASLDGGIAPSLWGVTGVEDVGGGYKIKFKLESGFSSVNGGFGNSNGNFFGRNAYVGIEAPFGTLKAGLQFSPFFLSMVAADPRDMPQFASMLNPFINSFGIMGAIENNALIYQSPTLAGFNGSVEYAFGNVAGSFPAGRHISAALNYDNGPVSATAAYIEAKDATSGATIFRGENVGVGYRLGPVTIKAAFVKYRNPSSDVALENINLYTLGATWLVTEAFTLNAGVYASRDRNVTANKSMLYGAGADYAMSKRTVLYGQIGLVNNKAGMNTSLAWNAPGTFTAPQGTTVGANIGIRHSF
jgi:predicted porin